MMNGGCLADRNTLSEPTNKDLLNPFVHHLELTTTYEKIKAGILTVVVLPVRLAIIIGLLVLAWFLACVGLYGLTEKDLQERPISPWRRKVRYLTAGVMRFLFFWFGFHWINVRGSKVSKYRAPLLVLAPHSSVFDILPIVYMKDASIVSRTENVKYPFIGSTLS